MPRKACGTFSFELRWCRIRSFHILPPVAMHGRASPQERPRCRRIAAESCVAAGAEGRAVQNVGASQAERERERGFSFKATPVLGLGMPPSSIIAFQGAPEHCRVQTEGHVGQQLPWVHGDETGAGWSRGFAKSDSQGILEHLCALSRLQRAIKAQAAGWVLDKQIRCRGARHDWTRRGETYKRDKRRSR